MGDTAVPSSFVEANSPLNKKATIGSVQMSVPPVSPPPNESGGGGDDDPLTKLEDQLTNEKLKQLEQIFEEADEDGGGGLDMDEFRQAMRVAMGDQLTDHELDILFMKVDTNCDGTVDWDEYLSYMLLEYRGKDDMNIHNLSKPFPKTPYVVPNMTR